MDESLPFLWIEVSTLEPSIFYPEHQGGTLEETQECYCLPFGQHKI